MELLSPDLVSFLSALAAIVVIDLMLAGDNAIMIALAARNVPKHLQRRVILWGTAGAIAVRVAMTLVVVWLLKIPGLAAAGGLLLVWIAYRLLAQTDTNEEHPVHTADGFWGAMRIIVVADAVMGLDNVLGVAGAAQGSWVLVTLGLLISIPIVVWGSYSHAAVDPALPGHHLPRRRRAGLDSSHDDRGRAAHPGPSRRNSLRCVGSSTPPRSEASWG